MKKQILKGLVLLGCCLLALSACSQKDNTPVHYLDDLKMVVLVWIHPPGLFLRRWENPGPLLRNGSGVRQPLGFPWGLVALSDSVRAT